VLVECSQAIKREFACTAGVFVTFVVLVVRRSVKQNGSFIFHDHKEILLGSKPAPALEVTELRKGRLI
jgi:hypothetical protein